MRSTRSETPSPAPNFDHIARAYRWCEYLALGPLLARTRTHHLARLGGRRNALVLGDGDGRFTAALLRRFPTVEVTAVDLSGVMLRLLSRRCRFAAARLRVVRQDVRTLLPADLSSTEGGADRGPQPFDLVVTHFLLDCLPQPEVDALVRRMVPALAPEALWLVSEFRVPPGALGPLARLYIGALYLAFRALTGLETRLLPDHATALTGAGFTALHTRRSLFGLLTTELWQLRPSEE